MQTKCLVTNKLKNVISSTGLFLFKIFVFWFPPNVVISYFKMQLSLPLTKQSLLLSQTPIIGWLWHHWFLSFSLHDMANVSCAFQKPLIGHLMSKVGSLDFFKSDLNVTAELRIDRHSENIQATAQSSQSLTLVSSNNGQKKSHSPK